MEGCYIPLNWRKDFSAEYLSSIRFICLAMTEAYIDAHFEQIMAHASDIERRPEDDSVTAEWLKRRNRVYIDGCRKFGEQVTLFDDCDHTG